MASATMPNPQASAPSPQGGGGASPQANPLQDTLGKIAMALKQISTQNTTIQPELEVAVSALVQAIQKSSQQAPGNPQQSAPAAPPQGA